MSDDKIANARALLARHGAGMKVGSDALWAALCSVTDLADAQAKEIADLKINVIAFGSVWAVTYAKQLGLPEGYLHPHHYDIFQRCGARMDDFTRVSLGDAK